jgi:anthranilate phosphoribosyltransferase
MASPDVPPTWPAVLSHVISGRDLDTEQASWAMTSIFAGEATSAQIASFVTALRAKGETPAEVEALVSVMFEHARLLDLAGEPVVLDVVGTGGDNSHSVNISTMAALVCAAAGIPVVKHGNRAASSSTGTADVLEELGVVIDLEPDLVAASVQDAGIGFCFAPVHHPAMRFAGPTRRELGFPTVFNILGPLTNPALARAALIGAANIALAPVMADVLLRRGVSALVVRGEDGLDEISTSAPTRIWDATGTAVVEVLVDATEFGISAIAPELLRGGDQARNAALLRMALGPSGSGTEVDAERVAAIRDAVALNAAAAMVAYDVAVGEPSSDSLTSRIAGRLVTAREVLEAGDALTLLDRWIGVTSSLRAATGN